MPLILSPGPLRQRAEFYHQLAQLTAAGIGLLPALAQIERHPPAASFRAPIRRLRDALESGAGFAEALPQTGGWVPDFDVALLQAGEQSGRLPECFRQLAEQYRDRAQLLRVTLAALVYPLCLLHFAILIFPLTRLIGLVLRGEVMEFVVQKLLVLVPLHGVVLLGALAAQGRRAGWRALLERMLHFVPVLGNARRCLAIARLASALEALIHAGVNILQAWELAAKASGSPALQRAIRAAKPELAAGATPAEMVAASREFPAAFAQLYQTGEISGTLDESMRRARDLYQEEGSRRLKTFMAVVTGAFFLAVMLLAAWQIIQFYLGHFQQIRDASSF